MRCACLVVTMLVGSAAADASVVAIKKVVATSERKTEDGRDIARYAFDGIDYPGVFTSWCTADGEGQGGELTVTFMADELIDGISIDVGAGAEVRALDVVSGDQVFRAVPVKGRADAKLGITTRSLTVRFAEVASSKEAACLSQITLERDGLSLTAVLGVPAKAVTPAVLGKAVVKLSAAAQRCKAGELAKLSAFPVGYDYIGGGDQTAHGQHKSAGVLARYCKGRGLGTVAVATAEEAIDGLRTGSGVGEVGVEVGDGRIWLLRWRRGRWLLAAIEGLVRRDKD